jgi:glycerol uptake facilitator-like aquaporin
LCELFGTALFSYIVVVSGANTFVDALGFFALLLIFGGVTGGHFNPTMTIGCYFYES